MLSRSNVEGVNLIYLIREQSFWVLAAWCVSLHLIAISTKMSAIILLALPAAAVIPQGARFLFRLKNGAITVLALSLVANISLLSTFKYHSLSVEQYRATLAPTVQLAICALAYQIFVRLKNRGPENVIFNFGSGLLPDRIYSMSVIFFCWVIPVTFWDILF